MTTTDERCPRSDLLVDQCADWCCAPDAEVIVDDQLAVDHRAQATPRPPRRQVKTMTKPKHLLGRLLYDLVPVYDQLGGLLTGHRTGPQGESVSGGGGITKPMPISDAIAEHRHQLLHDLRWWSRWVLRETGDVRVSHVKQGSEVEVAVAILLACPWLPEHEDAATLQELLVDWHRRARLLSDLPRLRTQLPVATHEQMGMADDDDPFPELASVWTCDGTVWALIPADRDQLVVLQCRGCKTRWDVRDLPGAQDIALPVADAARLAGVHRDTVYRWVKQDRVELTEDGTVKLSQVFCAVGA